MTIVIPKDTADFHRLLNLFLSSDHPDKRISLVTDTPHQSFDVPESLARAVGVLPPLEDAGSETGGEETPADGTQPTAAGDSGDGAPPPDGQPTEDGGDGQAPAAADAPEEPPAAPPAPEPEPQPEPEPEPPGEPAPEAEPEPQPEADAEPEAEPEPEAASRSGRKKKDAAPSGDTTTRKDAP